MHDGTVGIQGKGKRLPLGVDTFAQRPAIWQQIEPVNLVVVLDHVLLASDEDQTRFEGGECVVSERTWRTCLFIPWGHGLPGRRHVVHAADHEILHDASLWTEPSMDVDIPCLNARGEVWTRCEVLIKLELDPPRVDLLMRRTIDLVLLNRDFKSLRTQFLHQNVAWLIKYYTTETKAIPGLTQRESIITGVQQDEQHGTSTE